MDQVLVDALVEPLVAPAEKRDVVLLGQLVGKLVVEQPPGRGEQDDPGVLSAGICRLQRGIDYVDPQHHAGATAVGRIVHLASA